MLKVKIFKIKEGKLDSWKDWCFVLQNEKKKEAIETFQAENVKREICVLFKVGDNHFVIGLNESLDEKNNIKSGTNNYQINILHKEKRKECLESVDSGDVLYDLLLK